MKLTVIDRGTPESAIRVQEFLASTPAAAIHQHPDWAELAAPSRLQSFRHFLCEDDGGEIVSAGLIRMTRIVPGRYFAAIRRGPATRSPQELPAVLGPLESSLRRAGVVALFVGPHWQDDDALEVQEILRGAGYHRVPRQRQTLPTTTAVIDLTSSVKELEARMTSGRRREVRNSEKQGVAVRPVASEAEAAELNAIMREMADETGLETDSQHNFVRHFRYLARHPEMGNMQASFLGDRMFGGSVSYREGDRMYLLLLTSSPKVTTIPRSTALVWSDILAAKRMGCTHYDMVGFPDPEEEGGDAGARGRGAFKAGFGPRIVRLAPIMTKTLRPLDHALFGRLHEAYRASPLRSVIRGLQSR